MIIFLKKSLVFFTTVATVLLFGETIEEFEVELLLPQDNSLNEEHCTLLRGSNGLKVELVEKNCL